MDEPLALALIVHKFFCEGVFVAYVIAYVAESHARIIRTRCDNSLSVRLNIDVECDMYFTVKLHRNCMGTNLT